jgi:hypothetical protein
MFSTYFLQTFMQFPLSFRVGNSGCKLYQSAMCFYTLLKKVLAVTAIIFRGKQHR